MTELSTVHQSVAPIDEKKLTEWLDSTGLTHKLLPTEKSMFISIATLYGLNPFKREIYCNVYGEGQYRQCSIITGYEVYLKRADRLGKLNGWQATTSGSAKDGSLSATVTIHRKDWQHPFSHTVYFSEVCQKKKDGSLNAFWQKQPSFMTKKVAIAQAFRLCFPDEFGGMPYTNDELGADPIPQEKNITAEVEVITDIEPNSEEPILTTDEVEIQDDNRSTLIHLVNKYEKELSESPQNPTPLILCENAIASGDEGKIKSMLERAKIYLKKKGVEV